MIYKVKLTEQDYQTLRNASMRGQFIADFWEDDGVTKISSKNPRQLVDELEALLDSGADSWASILNVKAG